MLHAAINMPRDSKLTQIYYSLCSNQLQEVPRYCSRVRKLSTIAQEGFKARPKYSVSLLAWGDVALRFGKIVLYKLYYEKKKQI